MFGLNEDGEIREHLLRNSSWEKDGKGFSTASSRKILISWHLRRKTRIEITRAAIDDQGESVRLLKKN